MLSTPPAFILSQDQTLIKYVLLHKTLKSYFVTPRCFLKHQVCLVSLKLTSFNSFLILCLRIHSIAWMMFTKDVYLILMNSVLISKFQKRIFKVVFLFSYQSSLLSNSVFIYVWEAFVSLISRGDLIIIAPTRYYVNNFFHFFWIFFNFFENPLKYGISKHYKYRFWQLLDDIHL